jgi:excisionase family DNA binding protein
MPAPVETFTLAELARVIPLSRATIETLVRKGEIPARKRGRARVVAAADVEGFLQRCLASLHGEPQVKSATVVDAVPAPELDEAVLIFEEAEQPAVVRAAPILHATETAVEEHAPGDFAIVSPTIVEAEPATVQRAVVSPQELRDADRFVPRQLIPAQIVTCDATIVQMSRRGVRIHHQRPIRIGSEGRVSFRIDGVAYAFVMRGRVTWSCLTRTEEGLVYVSGLEVTAGDDVLAAAIDRMLDLDMLDIEDETLARKAEALRTKFSRQAVSRQADAARQDSREEQTVRRAMGELRNDPVRAQRWFNRARFSACEKSLQPLLPAAARIRDEALAVWEFLGRQVDLRVVCRVVAE